MPINFFFLNILFKVYICICNILVAEGLFFSCINNPLHYITLHYITLHYITLHYITLPSFYDRIEERTMQQANDAKYI